MTLAIENQRSSYGVNLALLLLLATLWGASYTFIKIGVATISPITLIAARTLIAGAVLLARRFAPTLNLATVEGANPRYTFKGDEIYVRARVVSSKPKTNPYSPSETETAWLQPVVRK